MQLGQGALTSSRLLQSNSMSSKVAMSSAATRGPLLGGVSAAQGVGKGPPPALPLGWPAACPGAWGASVGSRAGKTKGEA